MWAKSALIFGNTRNGFAREKWKYSSTCMSMRANCFESNIIEMLLDYENEQRQQREALPLARFCHTLSADNNERVSLNREEEREDNVWNSISLNRQHILVSERELCARVGRDMTLPADYARLLIFCLKIHFSTGRSWASALIFLSFSVVSPQCHVLANAWLRAKRCWVGRKLIT